MTTPIQKLTVNHLLSSDNTFDHSWLVPTKMCFVDVQKKVRPAFNVCDSTCFSAHRKVMQVHLRRSVSTHGMHMWTWRMCINTNFTSCAVDKWFQECQPFFVSFQDHSKNATTFSRIFERKLTLDTCCRLCLLSVGSFNRGDTRADLKCEGKHPLESDKLTVDAIQCN